MINIIQIIERIDQVIPHADTALFRYLFRKTMLLHNWSAASDMAKQAIDDVVALLSSGKSRQEQISGLTAIINPAALRLTAERSADLFGGDKQ
jgi:hypothetical protein